MTGSPMLEVLILTEHIFTVITITFLIRVFILIHYKELKFESYFRPIPNKCPLYTKASASLAPALNSSFLNSCSV